jgi:hypothetical protein
MSEDANFQRSMVREVEAAKATATAAVAKVSAHERECALRYENIERITSGLNDNHKDMNAKLDKLLDRVNADARALTTSQKAALTGIITLLIAALAWTGGSSTALSRPG